MYLCVQCNMMKTVLPKDQWPTYEEDRQKGRYVRGIVSLQLEDTERQNDLFTCQNQVYICVISASRVLAPYPDWVRIKLGLWIRIWKGNMTHRKVVDVPEG
jgi:hypothetical protein